MQACIIKAKFVLYGCEVLKGNAFYFELYPVDHSYFLLRLIISIISARVYK